MVFSKIIFVILFQVLTLVYSLKSKIQPYNRYNQLHNGWLPGVPNITYLDLTNEINHYLKTENKVVETYLQQALSVSTGVFYSTDVLLNDIMSLRPVVQLLNKNKLQNTTLSIKLSLRYTKDNRFNLEKLDDVFYDLSLNITPKSWTDIFANVDEILLDFRINDCNSQLPFYPTTQDNPTNTQIVHNFAGYIRSFRNKYCGGTEKCSIPVGILYSAVQLKCTENLKYQIANADHVTVSLDLSARKGLPLTQTAMTEYDANILQYNRRNPCFTFFLNEKIEPMEECVLLRVGNGTKQSTNSSIFCETYLKDLISDTVLNYQSTFIRRSVDNGVMRNTVILGNKFARQFVQNSIFPPNVTTYSAIPIALTDEISLNDVLKDINQINNGTIVVNHYAWRTLTRYANTSSLSAKQNAHLIFNKGIQQVWPYIGTSMRRLLTAFPKIGNVTLKTILFYEKDLKLQSQTLNQTESTYQPIVDFLEDFKDKYEPGCVVDFKTFSVEWSDVLAANTTSFHDAASQICNPVFHLTKLVIWSVGSDQYSDLNYSVALFKIQLLRKAFLKEFPKKEVYIKLEDPLVRKDAENLANFYRMPLIYSRKNNDDRFRARPVENTHAHGNTEWTNW